MAEIRTNEEYTEIGLRLISEKFPHLADVPVCFMSSDEEKKTAHKVTYGKCFKVDDKYKEFCPYTFMIVIYDMNICHFTQKKLEILIEHELNHCGINDTGNETKYYAVPHDREEFDSIIEQYGLYWDERSDI